MSVFPFSVYGFVRRSEDKHLTKEKVALSKFRFSIRDLICEKARFFRSPHSTPHRCHCGDSVDTYGHHGLSCSRSAGRFSRYSTINDIIRRSLATAHVPAVLEPIGLARSDGKRPDGMTLIPWRLGRSLLWDATCVDTLAASHIQATSSMVGAAASSAEQAKRRKYENLDSSFIFVPFGVETLGPWGPEARALFKELSKRVIESTGDPRAGSYLGQRISLAIQRGNAASILGTVPRCGGFEDVLDFI
ncbi:jg20825 [Pararge aegeria aegeria]|uniref:Jg20825 protein n=1 Tax=Pararge aegeria aegeria TaxID=348720 RepID=A0A8S4R5U8_9NEOP|nr:jg20825 [Pararge aegeria aegeria]